MADHSPLPICHFPTFFFPGQKDTLRTIVYTIITIIHLKWMHAEIKMIFIFIVFGNDFQQIPVLIAATNALKRFYDIREAKNGWREILSYSRVNILTWWVFMVKIAYTHVSSSLYPHPQKSFKYPLFLEVYPHVGLSPLHLFTTLWWDCTCFAARLPSLSNFRFYSMSYANRRNCCYKTLN